MLIAVAAAYRMSYAPVSLAARQLEPLDLPSLANLLDPSQEAYLRTRLSWPQFFKFRCLRLSAANSYINRASRNAAVLIAVGRIASKAADPEVALAGRDLERAALHIRIHAPLAILVLAGFVLLPGAYQLPAKVFAKQFEGLKECLDRLGGLRQMQFQ